MDLTTWWIKTALGILLDVSWPVQVVNIDAYFPSTKAHDALSENSPILKQKKYVFCYDLTLQDQSGKKLKVLLSPMLSSIQKGKIKIGSFIEVQKVTRLQVNGHFLVLNEWKNSKVFDNCQIHGWIYLCNYRNNTKMLCSEDVNQLSPWTLQFFLWNQCKEAKIAKDIDQGSMEGKSLKRLDESWTNLTSKWALAVRVLAISKSRLIMQPNNERRPWICLCNFLIADCTAYSVLTIWDGAVEALCQTICEGDILFLNKSYRIGRYAYNKKSYVLQPKRRMGISPTEIEIRINESDLAQIGVSTLASFQNLPPPIWNFVTSVEVVTKNLPKNSVHDMIGCVVYYGRWEREQCYDDFHKPSGQFWVRLWLIIVDHLSNNPIKIKLYVDFSRWKKLELLHPGEPVIITNMMNVKDESDEFSHLVSSNETQIFLKDQFTDKRFENEEVIGSMMKNFEGDFMRWAMLLKTHGGIGGYHPECQIFVPKRQRNQFVNRCQIRNQLKKLMLKESDRMVVKAYISTVKLCDHYTENEPTPPYSAIEVIGEVRSKENFILPLSGLYSDDLKIAVQDICFLTMESNREKSEYQTTPRESISVELMLSDCKVWALWPLTWEAINNYPKDRPVLITLNLFRYKEPADNKPDWDGVLIVINSVALDMHGSQQHSTTSSDSPIPNTSDLVKLFV